MSESSLLEIVLAAIAIIPTMTTILVSYKQNKQREIDKMEQERRDERNSAKSSIQNMITQDIIRAEILGKIPENRDNIEQEYTKYHACGGNGTITRQVNEYNDWISQFKPSKVDPTRIAKK